MVVILSDFSTLYTVTNCTKFHCNIFIGYIRNAIFAIYYFFLDLYVPSCTFCYVIEEIHVK